MQNDAVEQIQNLQDVIRYLSTERKGQDLQIINLSQLLAAAEARPWKQRNQQRCRKLTLPGRTTIEND